MARIKFTEGTLIEFEVSDVKQWRLVNFFARVMETKQEEGLKACRKWWELQIHKILI